MQLLLNPKANGMVVFCIVKVFLVDGTVVMLFLLRCFFGIQLNFTFVGYFNPTDLRTPLTLLFIWEEHLNNFFIRYKCLHFFFFVCSWTWLSRGFWLCYNFPSTCPSHPFPLYSFFLNLGKYHKRSNSTWALKNS